MKQDAPSVPPAPLSLYSLKHASDTFAELTKHLEAPKIILGGRMCSQTSMSVPLVNYTDNWDQMTGAYASPIPGPIYLIIAGFPGIPLCCMVPGSSYPCLLRLFTVQGAVKSVRVCGRARTASASVRLSSPARQW